MKGVRVKSGSFVEWQFNASAEGEFVFFYTSCGQMSGGVFMTPAQARALATQLLQAASAIGIDERAQASA